MESSPNQHRNALHAFHPKRGEAPDAATSQAVEAAMSDSGLRAFWEAEQAFDEAFSSKIAATPVPADLRARILQSLAAEPTRSAPTPIESVGAPVRSRNLLHWSAFFGAAAAVMLLAVLFTFVLNPFASRTSPEVLQMITKLEAVLEERSAPMQRADGFYQLASFLEAGGAPVPRDLPAGFAKEDGFACAEFEIDGVPVGMMCFRVEDGVYHIFTVDRSHFPHQADLPREVVKHVGGHCCATWTKDDRLYILATKEPEDKMLTLL